MFLVVKDEPVAISKLGGKVFELVTSIILRLIP